MTRDIVDQAIADLRAQYAGTLGTLAWTIVPPATLVLLYGLVFHQVMQPVLERDYGTTSYALFLCSGIIPWIQFSECLSRGTACLLQNAHFITKLPIPEESYFARLGLSSLFAALASLVPLVVLAAVIDGRASWTWLLLPFFSALWILPALGLSMILGVANVFLRDVGLFLSPILNVGLWTLPIVYAEGILLPSIQGLFPFHPLYPALRCFRLALLGRVPEFHWIALAGMWSLVALGLGIAFLRHQRSLVRDEL